MGEAILGLLSLYALVQLIALCLASVIAFAVGYWFADTLTR
jgi:hypothetical protein